MDRSVVPIQAERNIWRQFTLVGLGLTLGLVTAGAFFYWRRYRDRRLDVSSTLPKPARPVLEELTGLTEAEAAQRLTVDPDEIRAARRGRITRRIVKSNTLSIFNATVLGLAFTMIVLNDLFGALLSLAVLLFNIVLNTGQQLHAARQIEGLADRARLSVTVLRDGRDKHIDYLRAVEGDIVVFGPGDEFIGTGVLLTTTSIWVGRSGLDSGIAQLESRQTGDRLHEGEICATGAGAYRLTEPPAVDLEAVEYQTVPEISADSPPIQRLIDRILRILIGMIVLFSLFLILSLVQVSILTPEMQTVYIEIASIIFSLAPGGLFFAVLVAYALGAASLAQHGALIRGTSLVEALAQTTVICFGKAGILTNTRFKTDIAPASDPSNTMEANRVIQLLGVFAHSAKPGNTLTQLIAKSYSGHRYAPTEEVSFASTGGWQSITLGDPEVRGTYFLGYESALNDQLWIGNGDESAEDREKQSEREIGPRWRHPLHSLRNRLRRNRPQESADSFSDANLAPPEREAATDGNVLTQQPAPGPNPSDGNHTPSLGRRFATTLAGIASRTRRRQESESDGGNSTTDIAKIEPENQVSAGDERLLFAYLPEPQVLHDKLGRPQLPDGLIPLTYLDIAHKVRTGADDAIVAFLDAGVSVKTISAGDATDAVALLQQLGIAKPQESQMDVLRGSDFDELDGAILAQAVAKAEVIAGVTPGQHREVIQLLQENDETVTVVGDTFADAAAMHEAAISVSLHSSSQAAITEADVILVRDSLGVLADTLRIGQRVVNGLLNTLKLNFTQIGYVLLLLIVMLFSPDQTFVVSPSQNGIIIFFTLFVPSLALTLWARYGAVPRDTIGRRLGHFVIPAAGTIALSVLLVEWQIAATNTVEYSRLIVTNLLVMEGLTLVPFVHPAIPLVAGNSRPNGDWRPIWLSIGLYCGFLALSALPLAQQLFGLGWLATLQEYLLLAGVTIGWGIVLQAIWRFIPQPAGSSTPRLKVEPAVPPVKSSCQ